MKNLRIPLAIAALAFALGSSAQAQVWTHAASACVPDETATNFEMNGAKFKLLLGAVGTVDARCNVTDPLDAGATLNAWGAFQITYQDPDGVGVGSRVQAFLYKVPNATANPVLIKNFDSNAYGVLVLTTVTLALPAGIVFDFQNNAYFVQIEVTKAAEAPNTEPFIAIVRLK
jgi:hypothetical protein